ncbi:hypothetical protein ABE28_004430 [Peribacillus muralis]|uniref:Uncharacterized protein n=1 Tax=Peribacillus muralis TaxID=264697 RepID=A0A1B3XK43_9BACI|nr:hypothetical protein [Peribacillus muralis]AOH53588.1 hypothetical protein ABE28_004430 [Peribacillus muralis]
MYNSPVLFDKSITIVNQFTSRNGRRKFVIISDQAGYEKAKVFTTEIADTIAVEFLAIRGVEDSERIKKFILSQRMGTQFYIAAAWNNAVMVFKLGVEAGLSEDEIQVVIIGPKRRYVYCMKCFEVSGVEEKAEVTECGQCKASLEIGPFYSIVREGYIGYPFIPAGKEEVVGS